MSEVDDEAAGKVASRFLARRVECNASGVVVNRQSVKAALGLRNRGECIDGIPGCAGCSNLSTQQHSQDHRHTSWLSVPKTIRKASKTVERIFKNQGIAPARQNVSSALVTERSRVGPVRYN